MGFSTALIDTENGKGRAVELVLRFELTLCARITPDTTCKGPNLDPFLPLK